jgi:hypothetical protein
MKVTVTALLFAERNVNINHKKSSEKIRAQIYLN